MTTKIKRNSVLINTAIQLDFKEKKSSRRTFDQPKFSMLQTQIHRSQIKFSIVLFLNKDIDLEV